MCVGANKILTSHADLRMLTPCRVPENIVYISRPPCFQAPCFQVTVRLLSSCVCYFRAGGGGIVCAGHWHLRRHGVGHGYNGGNRRGGRGEGRTGPFARGNDAHCEVRHGVFNDK